MSGDLPIEKYLRDIDILNETAAQIQKEFSFFSLEIHFSGSRDTAYRELSEQIQPHVSRLMQHEYERFLGLLYRIDIRESLLAACPPGEKMDEYVTGLIIRRCLQKVVLRKLYS